ncbi:hypothetical protein WJX81_004303 [Elliptochloris bilobata]|uniref:Chloroplast chaperonin 10 n=1 Tax=Elliptochloris bilobata TaxID=381761 RepID=A0AAW1S9C8_9CHLO
MSCAAVAVAAEASSQPLDLSKMEPLGDRVLVKPFEAQKVSAGGVLLAGGTTDAMADALLGEVLAVGSEVDVGVAAGDSVIFSKYSSSDVKLPAGGEVCFVAQKSILATLSK